MEALVQYLKEKVDLSDDKAQMAAEAAIEFIKSRVAHSLDDKVDAALKTLHWSIKAEVHEALTGEPAATFYEKMGDFAEGAKEKLGDFAEGAKDKISDFAKSAKNFFAGFGKKEEKKEEGDAGEAKP
ncbi:MAG: hypothetical protein OHK0053_28320 [Microscillaceae bacterium]